MLNRRDFLKHSALFATAGFLPQSMAMSEQSAQVPWMYKAGEKDSPYGMPSMYEEHV